MPVEIKELVIRTVVGNAAAAPPDDRKPGAAAAAPDAGGMERIVQECVRQVMRILAKDRER